MTVEPTVVPDGWLDHVPIAWHRVARYERDENGQLAREPRTRQAIFLGLSDQWKSHPIGWTDRDHDGLVWVLG